MNSNVKNVGGVSHKHDAREIHGQHEKENNYKRHHARHVSLMDGDEEHTHDAFLRNPHQQHAGVFRPYHAHAVPPSPPHSYENKYFANYAYYEETPQDRKPYNEAYRSRQGAETPPPPHLEEQYSAVSPKRYEIYEETSSLSPNMKDFTHYPSTPNRQSIAHPSPFWHQEQGQHYDASYHYPHQSDYGLTPPRSSSTRRIGDADVRYTYTFDRHGALDNSRSRDHRLPNEDSWGSEINSPRRANAFYSPPPPRTFEARPTYDYTVTSPPGSTEGVDHKASFAMMMEDAANTPRLPNAASEVDFDVTDPPKSPVTEPSKDPLCISPDELNCYDVLLGRGGGTNSQIGNRHFRSLVQDFQPIYLSMKRKDKPLMARSIVLIVRKRGGRFLRKGDTVGEYYEVGDKKAEAKASQALREGMEVRAITRKRKEVYFQQREIEHERRKMIKLSCTSDAEHNCVQEEYHHSYPSRTFVPTSSIDEEGYNYNMITPPRHT
mmetsp:Transcript_25400/g.36893  ORF Transcript_25400/g.36893 Transcript_25400/m.36893 type:complete len:492 (-) Transcript_25400:240-1715(-)